MFSVGDRIYVREDLEMNQQDFSNTKYLGAEGVAVKVRGITWSTTDNVLVEVLLDGDPNPKEWFSIRLGHCLSGTPDWEV